MRDVFLILENGAVFKGKPFGYDGEAIGPLAYSTKMTGYMQTLSDRSYSGRILFQTFPLIGNYGVITEELGNEITLPKAYIVRQWCQEPSNFRSEGTLDIFLRDKMIPGLYDVDTRALMHIVRKHGAMQAMISRTPDPAVKWRRGNAAQ